MRRARIIGDEMRGNSLKPSDDSSRMQRSDNQRNGDSNDERCDQRTLHENQAFCADAAG